MTLREFSNEFDVLYNNITSNQAPGLDEYEKSVFLTKALDEIVKSYFDPKLNKPQEGFDGSERRQIDFSMIMRSKTYCNYLVKIAKVPEEFSDDCTEISQETLDSLSIGSKIIEVSSLEQYLLSEEYLFLELLHSTKLTIIKDATIVGYGIYYTPFEESFFDLRDNTKSVLLNNDILMFINEYVEVKRDNSKSRLIVLPINYTEYSRKMSKPYMRPLKNQAWRLLDNSDSRKKAEIVVGPNDELRRYVMRYVKRPKAIRLLDFEGEITIDGDNLAQECELDPILHEEILQRAVEMAKASYIGDLQSQLALGSVSLTNIGAVPQSR